MTFEYNTTDLKRVCAFIDDKIGVDFEVTKLDSDPLSGSIVVFELEAFEDDLIDGFMTEHKLFIDWSSNEL